MRMRLKFATTGGIAAQREDVFTTQPLDFFQKLADLFAGVVDAGQVGQSNQPVLPLNAIHNHQRLVARGAAGAVSDGAEIRFAGEERGDVFSKHPCLITIISSYPDALIFNLHRIELSDRL